MTFEDELILIEEGYQPAFNEEGSRITGWWSNEDIPIYWDVKSIDKVCEENGRSPNR